jgi:hypothetical protein
MFDLVLMKLYPLLHLFVLTILLLPLVAHAQEGQQIKFPKPEMYAQDMVNQLSDKMELSDEQKGLLTGVFTRFMTSHLEAKTGSGHRGNG